MIKVDSIVCGELIITMDTHRRVINKGAIAVDKGGIVAIDEASIIKKKYISSVTIDVGNDVILPGFINGHTHSPMTLLRGCGDNESLATWLRTVIFPLEKALIDREFSYWGTVLAIVEMIRAGITTTVDMYWHVDGIAQACHDMGMRAIVGSTLLHHDHELDAARQFVQRWKGHDYITPAYAPHSIAEVPLDLLRKACDAAQEQDTPLLVHVDETAYDVEHVYKQHHIRPIALLAREKLLSSRCIVAHVVHTSDEELDIIAHCGAGIIHCPTSNMKLASGIAPVVTMLQKGCLVGLGTDGAASNNSLSIMSEMKLAVLLQRVARGQADCIDAITALECATIKGAQAIHKGHEIGSLEVGKKADIISISRDHIHQLPDYDVISTLVFASSSFDVRTVIINGILKLRNGILMVEDQRINELRNNVAVIRNRVMGFPYG